MAIASVVTCASLGETSGTAQPFDEPVAGLDDWPGAVRQDVTQQKMAGKHQPVQYFLPGSAAALADKGWKLQELARIGLRLSGADCPSRLGTDGDEIVVAAR